MFAAILAAAVSTANVAYQDWMSGAPDSDTFAALTINDGGSVFGQACSISADNCNWVVTMNQACKPGDSYGSLVNTDNPNVGSLVVTLVCDRQVNQKWRYLIGEADDITKAVTTAGGTRLGFAVALQDGSFVVVRFSIAGATDARRDMLSRASEAQKQSTGDIKL
jgi:hypothetical protein